MLGMHCDRNGRKAAMILVTSMMTAAIFFITFASTYEQVGIAAPVIILIARVLQGFAIGGGFGTSTALLIEMVPPRERGFYGSWRMTGQMAALLFCATIATLITDIFTSEQLMA